MTDTATKPAEVKVGDIFYESWGYDQTNIDFYEVVKVTKSGKSCYIKHIRKGTDETGHVVAAPGTSPDAKPMLKRISRWTHRGEEHVSLYMTSYSCASPWNGQPLYDTIAAGQPGH